MQLSPLEVEEIESSFPCVKIFQTQNPFDPSNSKLFQFTISIPIFKSEEEKESFSADYQNPISVTMIINVKKEKNIVTLKELCVTSEVSNNEGEADSSLQQLSAHNCSVLQEMYLELLLAASTTGNEDDDLSFSVEEEELAVQEKEEEATENTAGKTSIVTTISSNGALSSLIIQMLTDATDASLPDTLAAHQLTGKSSAMLSKKHHQTISTTTGASASLSSRMMSAETISSSSSSQTTPFTSPVHPKNGDFPGIKSIVDKNLKFGAGLNNKNNTGGDNNNNKNSSSSSSSTVIDAASSSFTQNANAIQNQLLNQKIPRLANTHLLLNVLCRVRVCKIDHMRSLSTYTANIAQIFDSLRIADPLSSFFCCGEESHHQNNNINDQQHFEGLLGTMTVHDPNSPRVLLCLLSVLVGDHAKNPITAVDAGSLLAKDLRTNFTDVDSHGRKCRERMMRDLGAWNVNVYAGTDKKMAATKVAMMVEYWKRMWNAPSPSSSPATSSSTIITDFSTQLPEYKKVTPQSRDEGISVVKKFFVEPMQALSVSREDSKQFTSVANDILHDKNLWDHV